ncbi:MAG TPA: DUF2071 domain-containing protein [Solirubrobacteraceae bacterium]
MKPIADAVDLLAAPCAQGRVTRIREHRPWPLPRSPWVMGQTWTDLLFAHWDVAPASVQAAVPPQLPLDTHDGRAWIGVTPFRVRNLRLRLTFPVPVLSTFPEINVRTYVVVDGKPGIYFFSLDADSPLAVAAARRLYRLPYFRARMSIERHGSGARFLSRRSAPEAPAEAVFRAGYVPAGDAFEARPGTLEHWLTERYCLYTLDERRRVLRGEIHHPPWPLQHARAEIETNTMTAEIGLELGDEPLLHYARRQDVVFWPLQAAQPAAAGTERSARGQRV